MGSDKALMLLSEIPLIQHVTLALKAVSDEQFVVAPTERAYQFLDLPIYQDPIPNTGALGGLYAALYHARGRYVINAACDMPFLSGPLFKFLCAQAEERDMDVVIPWPATGPEPMHAVYRRETCLPAVEDALKRGERKMIGWHPAVRVLRILPSVMMNYDPEGLCFWNINTPEDLLEAENYLFNL